MIPVPMLLAYIEPGSGGYLLQMLMAGGMALTFTLSRLPRMLANGWRRLLGKKPTPLTSPTPPTRPGE